MKTRFKPGQRIVCVVPCRDYEHLHPKKGHIYTVEDYNSTMFETRPLINVREVEKRTGWHEYRFKPVEDEV